MQRPSDSSSSSEDERDPTVIRNAQKAPSTAHTDDHSSAAETNTIQSSSPTPSGQSETATQNSFDAASINTSTSTNVTNTAATSTNTANAKQQGPGNIPIIRPPVLQNPTQQGIRPDGASTSSSSVGSLVGPGNSSYQQQPQQRQQQTQFSNQIPPNQVYNELLGPNAFKDVMLNIDYGAMEAYNIGIQEPYTVPNPQAAAGHNQGRQFDPVKAIFNLVDTNHDGSISRDEFQQWAQGASQNYGGQSYENYQTTGANNQTGTAANYQPTVADYQARNSYGNNFNLAQLYDGASPEIANLLRQSGINN